MILEHYAKNIVTLDRTRTYEQRVHFKPRGFWVSVPGEDDWPTWVKAEDFHPESYKTKHEVRFTETANILYLDTVEKIKEFHEKYKKSLVPEHARYTSYIDWLAVAEDYDGIVIAPYQWSLRLDDDVFWYYSWDVASGCIWNLDAIDTIR